MEGGNPHPNTCYFAIKCSNLFQHPSLISKKCIYIYRKRERERERERERKKESKKIDVIKIYIEICQNIF